MDFLEEIKNTTTEAIFGLNQAKILDIKKTIREFASVGKMQCSVNLGDNPDMIIRYFTDLGFSVIEEPYVGQEFSNAMISW